VLQQLGGKADIGLPGSAEDPPHLAERIGLLNPFAQIAVGDGMFEIAGCWEGSIAR
jgi:hypothetical protein